ncbi:MAG: hypothetical protein ACE3JK_07055 [Sporolactobacillus sp.]
MHLGKTDQIIFCIGLSLSFFQLIFGVFSLLFTQIHGTESFLFTHADRLTSSGAANSLRLFSTAAIFASATSLALASCAWLLHAYRNSSVLAGLMLIFAGAANSVILYFAGLPAGVILMVSGILFLAKHRNLIGKSDDH